MIDMPKTLFKVDLTKPMDQYAYHPPYDRRNLGSTG
jgi:hypothetical protein